MDEWTTNVQGTTGKDGKFKFRGFQGTYDIIVDYPDAAAVKQTLTLTPGSTVMRLKIPFDVHNKSVPEQPAELSAVAADSRVILSWDEAEGATG